MSRGSACPFPVQMSRRALAPFSTKKSLGSSFVILKTPSTTDDGRRGRIFMDLEWISSTPSVEQLANHLKDLIAEKDVDLIRPRILISISGIPGSGKTTLATKLADLLNSQVSEKTPWFKTVAISMDGYHLRRAQLDAEGLRRRGAPHTFDADGVVALVERLRMSTYRPMPDITAPSFDHAIKDPVEDDVLISRSTNIIILEGNYLLLKDDPWNKIHSLVNESWLLDAPFDMATERLAKRHVAAGIAQTLEEGRNRVQFNDMPNGQYLLENSLRPTVTIVQKGN